MKFYEGKNLYMQASEKFFKSLVEDCDDLYETSYALDALKNEINSNPKEAVKMLSKMIAYLEEAMLDEHICPECGGKIVAEEDNSKDIHDSYGKVAQGYSYVCDYCGKGYDL